MIAAPRLDTRAVIRAAGAIAIAATLAACSDREGARQAVEAYGLTQVQPLGYVVFGCGDQDSVRDGFTARNSTGQRVEGVACREWGPFGKGWTVRILRVVDDRPSSGGVPLQ